jgi:hypothetical protein
MHVVSVNPLRRHTACAEEARSLILRVAKQDGLDAAAAPRRIQDDPA